MLCYSTRSVLAVCRYVALFKTDGFNVKQLMSDNRFRLATVLGEAGLGGGKYAHDMLLSKVPAANKNLSSSILK